MAENRKNYSLPYTSSADKKLIAAELRLDVEALHRLITFCIGAGIQLFRIDDGCLICDTLIRRICAREDARRMKSEAGRNAVNKRWGDRRQSHIDAQSAPAWFPLFVAQFRNEYPKGSKSFIGADTVEQELYKAVLNGAGEPNRDEAKCIIDGTRLYAKHIDSINESEEKFELIAASRWIKDKGWLNNYGGQQ